MRILFVANGYPPTAYGGVEVYVSELAENLAARGHEVAVFCRESQPGKTEYSVIETTEEGVPVFRVINNFDHIRALPDRFLGREIEALFEEVLRKFAPDLVHFNHTIGLSARLPGVAAQHHIPSVFTLHDFWPMCQKVHLMDWQGKRCPGPARGGNCFKCITSAENEAWYLTLWRLAKQTPPFSRVYQRFRDYLHPNSTVPLLEEISPAHFALRQKLFQQNLKHSQQVIVPSEFLRTTFIENDFEGNIYSVLPLGIKGDDRSLQPRRGDSALIFGFAGNIVQFKGVKSLISAFRQVNHPAIQLHLYGRDNANPTYAAQAKALAEGDPRIVFKGAVPLEQRYDIFRQIDALVIPTTGYETFSFVAREALVSGVPVIAANAGALPEIIQEGVNGFLFPPGDIPALAQTLERIARQPEMLRKLTLPGPVEVLSIEAHVDRLLAIYASAGQAYAQQKTNRETLSLR